MHEVANGGMGIMTRNRCPSSISMNYYTINITKTIIMERNNAS